MRDFGTNDRSLSFLRTYNEGQRLPSVIEEARILRNVHGNKSRIGCWERRGPLPSISPVRLLYPPSVRPFPSQLATSSGHFPRASSARRHDDRVRRSGTFANRSREGDLGSEQLTNRKPASRLADVRPSGVGVEKEERLLCVGRRRSGTASRLSLSPSLSRSSRRPSTLPRFIAGALSWRARSRLRSHAPPANAGGRPATPLALCEVRE